MHFLEQMTGRKHHRLPRVKISDKHDKTQRGTRSPNVYPRYTKFRHYEFSLQGEIFLGKISQNSR